MLCGPFCAAQFLNFSMANIIPSPLYHPDQEHDACGVGFIANIRGEKSHSILDRALIGLKNLAHRGAIDADAVTGDGAGVLTEIPVKIFSDYLHSKGKTLYQASDLGVGMIFLPRDDEYAQAHGRRIVEQAIKNEGIRFISWRQVPVDATCLGKKAELTRPQILQAIVARGEEMDDDEYERRLFLAMRCSMRKAGEAQINDFYICSFSSRTIVYKGLLNAPQVRQFFLDLKSPAYETSFAIFHQRFATNTFPDWQKAQPYRMLAHNGEINTIRGNRNLMRAREFSPNHGIWGDRYSDLSPFVQPGMSDSASLDNALQVMTTAGRSCLHGASILMPTAWENDPEITPAIRDFFRTHSLMMENWDGPAAIAFTDGRFLGASLDRNGLRPARFKVYEDDTIVLGSEAGVIPEWGSKVKLAGRLGPGKMLAVDFTQKRIMFDREIKEMLASTEDYGSWCEKFLYPLSKAAKTGFDTEASLSCDELLPFRVAFGLDEDEEEIILKPMYETGLEAVGSMGDDTPLAVLSSRPRLIYTYFKQLFAQVTNPAIDSLRENMVMSLNMALGGRLGLFEPLNQACRFVSLDSPVLFDSELQALEKVSGVKTDIRYLDATFAVEDGPEALEKALKRLREQARSFVQEEDARILVLSDRGIRADKAAIPMLIAVGAIHQELVNIGRRLSCDIIAETAEARDVHAIACLLSFGANAVNPYLALAMVHRGAEALAGEGGTPDYAKAYANYRKAINKGILKIMSKMGISTLMSYQSAQVFEALGISNRVIDDCFVGTSCPIGGIGYPQIAEETVRRHLGAFPEEVAPELWSEGYYTVKKKGDGEFHGWNPRVIAGMNKFLRGGGDYDNFGIYRDASNDHPPVGVKDLLRFRKIRKPVELSEVEPIEDIRRRFTTAGMSLGAISPETHECLAIAMNSIGGKSNSGEGGEDPVRFHPFENGDNANSAIKQVASGRFGVTAEYLANAREIEIKIAQGAKPGEGGQLPGHKVTDLIARLRFSVPGVTLISPPPHHDIYSIEDLAQLIFDLKEVNPRAKVCVKLVSSSGIGTIAAGVAKAYADVILVSGHDGGTGASPISSIKNAGSGWEIGLSEVHQVLMMNGLRNRVVLRTDGGMKTGRDIVLASLLGAEEFNFGTSALIAAGCAMFRVCHLNTCPVGVATQRDDLRAKFRGKPEYVIQYFNAIAEDVRRLMAELGYRTMDEMIGRVDELEQIVDPANPKTRTLNFSGILHNPDPTWEADRTHTRERNDRFGNEGSIDDQLLQEAKETITHLRPKFKGSFKVRNIHRDIGTRLSGEIAYMHGNTAMAPGTIDLTFKGSAGQSFGTFLIQGIRLRLVGEANDYVGKGMNGGEIILSPHASETYAWDQNIIMGNTCLYGATGGHLFAAGQAGERFAVRNSGATAVVEGVGDHGCEYMTGGTIVVLGEVGRNFGAGMSGGSAFILDESGKLETRINDEMVFLEKLDDNTEIEALKLLIQLQANLTGSPKAKALLGDWESTLGKFMRVTPRPTSPEAPKQRIQKPAHLVELALV
jgi:glutamate synthase (ferredoxin)